MNIRLMRPDDIPRGLALCRASGWNQVQADWEQLLARGAEGSFVAEADGGRRAAEQQPQVPPAGRADPAIGLDQMWVDYLAWLKTRFQLPELRPEALAEYTRLALWHEFRAHPIRFSLRYGRSLLRPQTYKTLWRLLRPPARS